MIKETKDILEILKNGLDSDNVDHLKITLSLTIKPGKKTESKPNGK